MRDVWEELVKLKLVKWAYGFVENFVNSSCEGIGRECFIDVTKEYLFLSMTVRLTGMIRKRFKALCVKKLGLAYNMILYSKNRWSSIKMMFKRVLKMNGILVYTDPPLIYDCNHLQIDRTFPVTIRVNNIIEFCSFWDSVGLAELACDSICKAVCCCRHLGQPWLHNWPVFLCVFTSTKMSGSAQQGTGNLISIWRARLRECLRAPNTSPSDVIRWTNQSKTK